MFFGVSQAMFWCKSLCLGSSGVLEQKWQKREREREKKKEIPSEYMYSFYLGLCFNAYKIQWSNIP